MQETAIRYAHHCICVPSGGPHFIRATVGPHIDNWPYIYIYIYIHKTYTSAPPFYINTKRCDLIYDASTSVFGGHNVSYEIK
jgi:hypothetical protein